MCDALSISIIFCSAHKRINAFNLHSFQWQAAQCVCSVSVSVFHRVTYPSLVCTTPHCYTTGAFSTATVLDLIRSLDIMALCVHMLYSMCMHSCLNTCLRENMRLNCLPEYAGMHAYIHVNAPVFVICDCIACLSPPKNPQVSVWVCERVCECLFMCAFVCMWTVFQASSRALPLT